MIYIITLVILCLFIYKFDLGDGNKNDARICYNIMTVWLIVVSGFAFQVGADIPRYMREYDLFSIQSVFGFSDIISFKDNRQPLWIFLEYLCHSISPDFVLFKLVIAIICNWAVSHFISKHSNYPFISLLFFCLLLYLNLNFNALRQYLAIAFFLIGYDFLVDKNWVKYYSFATIAFLFHYSAIFLFLLPVIHLISISRRSVNIISIILIVSVFFILRLDLLNILYSFIIANSGLFTEEMSELTESYLGGNLEAGRANINGMILIALQVLVVIFIVVANMRNSVKSQSLILKLLIIYAILIILNRAVPIIFTRYMQYFEIFYCCMLPSAFIPICKRIARSSFIPFLIIALLSIMPVHTLMSENKRSGIPLIKQYSPYYSVFNPKVDPVRNAYFGSYHN